MYITIKLSLDLNEHLKHCLTWYETIYHKEIKRIADIFIKENHSYEYLYKNISNHISFHSKHLVLDFAKKNTNIVVDVKIAERSAALAVGATPPIA